MVTRLLRDSLKKGKDVLIGPQASVLSAATIIMVMIVASRFLGLVRQRTLAYFFTPDEISVFFAAFRLPDSIFEILVFGTFSSAFIPVFTKALKDKDAAWKLASRVTNIGILVYILFFIGICFFAEPIYWIIAPGYSPTDQTKIVQITKLLFAAEGFFVVSYILTGVLESFRRFLIPAMAPLLYNIGIIVGIVCFHDQFGLLAPAIGVFIGAVAHFLIQLPLALKLGYRFTKSFSFDTNVKKIGRLAAPRILEVGVNQIAASVELFLSSLISTASYAYFTLGNNIQLIPVGIVGTSVAKAALPTLSEKSDSPEEFSKTLWSLFSLIVFFILPIGAFLIVLRIPIVRLLYGTQIFDWNSTLETGAVVSAFALSVIFQATVSLLSRGFYALHDTKTPVKISIFSLIINIILNFIFIFYFHLSVWGLALAFSIAEAIQMTVLFYLMLKRTKASVSPIIHSLLKPLFASIVSAFSMYVVLKIFDKSVWVKRLSFLGKIDATQYLPFESFVLDTRYTFNLVILTLLVSAVGLSVYLGISILLKTQEVFILFNLIKRIFVSRHLSPVPQKEEELVTPSAKETLN